MFGIDDALMGSLISAGTKIFGGLLGQESAEKQQQRAIDAQNYVNQTQLTFRAQDATNAERATGINRLSLLGVSPSSGPTLPALGNPLGDSISGAGQDIGRAVASLADKKTRADELNEQLLEAKIANVNADTARMLAVASSTARTLGQPGTPPGVPLPRPDMRRVGEAFFSKPLMENYVDELGAIHTLPTANASTAMQNWASMPSQIVVAGEGARRTLQNAMRSGRNTLSELWRAVPPIRGDVLRSIDNSQYTPF